ncbi:dinitrogenase iron-molybdenum cofactor biosynthesis protein (plasmid) [Stanieria cyanosphaera PCC 7437]|uniref:Dinitrogenase iron-molybdenum cofactor biosynthesis protein n=1 Tax=Stanieria cyanosphaera (strain ATCC 29371 / PCC 7437) TaxID=111780 RepID=K9Y176_STAC7|nr:NifB/NifX family molybdenum-iron cluster-binding protein [Stanieria cyanosphaera]AFZ38141.1 dinitrogenase iron-molybdenum cofactor biosynthesis protein [Stanieria cyanosphaera PCC 7437]
MKIAVASQNRINITSHTGKCRNFWIYEVNSQEILNKKLLQLSKEESFLNSFPHIPQALNNIQVLISGGIGCGLMNRLEEQGIEGIVTSEREPDLAVITYLESSLVRKLSQPRNRQRRYNRRRDRSQHLHGHAYHLPTINLGKTV